MTVVKALAKVTVSLYVDAENLREGEKLTDHFLRAAEHDSRLISYVVTQSEWVPETFAPRGDES